MKYAVAMHGGLGDVLLSYLLPVSDAGFVQGMKAANPAAFVRCAVMSTAPAVADLFSDCPLFDEVAFEIWDGDWQESRARLTADCLPVDRSVEWRQPEIYLKPDEADDAGDIEFLGPFVALHPFAGTENRDWRGKPIDIRWLIDCLCDAGQRVVLLGGSSQRTDGKGGVVRKVELDETFHYELPLLTNMVGRASVRLQAYLATRAKCFIGSFSAYHCAAFAMGIPAYVLAGSEMEGFFNTTHPVYRTLAARAGARFDYFERMPADILDRMVQFTKANTHV